MSELFRNVLISNSGFSNVFIVFLLLIVVFQMIFYYFAKKRSARVSGEKVKYLESCNEEVTDLYDNVRGFRHDFNNMMQIIGGYITLDDMDGLKKYYRNLTTDCKDINGFKVAKITDVEEPTVFNLLFSKSKRAHDFGVDFNFIALTSLKILNVNMYEYTKILGVLLDNAIEAASECDYKIVNITFSLENDSKTIDCLIENTYVDKNIDISKIYEKDFTTKSRKKNSGLGLWGVRKILDDEKTIELETKRNDIFFSQRLSCECI